MTSLKNKLQKIEFALTSIDGLQVYHYWRFGKDLPYCIWQEVSEADSFEGDNHKGEQAISVTVDYFTRTEYDPMADSIQSALDGAEDVSWRYESIQFEEDSNTIHHEWMCEVM